MHTYVVTLASIFAADTDAPALQFRADSHDDLAALVKRVPSSLELGDDEAKAMIVGLKLLTEVVLKHRKRAPFADLSTSLREFTQALKQQALMDSGKPAAK